MSYHNCLENASNSTFTIQSSYLLHGRDPNTYIYPNGGINGTAAGLAITFSGSGCSNIVFYITNVTAKDNIANEGGHFEIIYLINSITNSFHIAQCVLEDGGVLGNFGGGLRIWSSIGFPGTEDIPCGPNINVHRHHFLKVINTTFVNNVGGALSIEQDHRSIVCKQDNKV